MEMDRSSQAIELRLAIQHLLEGERSDDPLVPVILGLDRLIPLLANNTSWPADCDKPARDFCDVIRLLAPPFSEAMAGHILPHTTYMALGSLSSLVIDPGNMFRLDQLAYVRIQHHQMGVILYRRDLGKRGHAMFRDFVAHHVWNTADRTSLPLQ